MKLIRAREAATEYLFAVHLDTAQTIPDPEAPTPAAGEPDTRAQVPDPQWVSYYRFGKQVAVAGQTKANYLAACRREAKALAQAELAGRAAASVLNIEGEDL